MHDAESSREQDKEQKEEYFFQNIEILLPSFFQVDEMRKMVFVLFGADKSKNIRVERSIDYKRKYEDACRNYGAQSNEVRDLKSEILANLAKEAATEIVRLLRKDSDKISAFLKLWIEERPNRVFEIPSLPEQYSQATETPEDKGVYFDRENALEFLEFFSHDDLSVIAVIFGVNVHPMASMSDAKMRILEYAELHPHLLTLLWQFLGKERPLRIEQLNPLKEHFISSAPTEDEKADLKRVDTLLAIDALFSTYPSLNSTANKVHNKNYDELDDEEKKPVQLIQMVMSEISELLITEFIKIYRPGVINELLQAPSFPKKEKIFLTELSRNFGLMHDFITALENSTALLDPELYAPLLQQLKQLVEKNV